jgi:hypothetical protein
VGLTSVSRSNRLRCPVPFELLLDSERAYPPRRWHLARTRAFISVREETIVRGRKRAELVTQQRKDQS